MVIDLFTSAFLFEQKDTKQVSISLMFFEFYISQNPLYIF